MTAKLAILLAAFLMGRGEPAWWEGAWVGEGMSCASTSGDSRPFRLRWNRLEFVESECWNVREKAAAGALILVATCRDHGQRAQSKRSFALRPREQGKAMVMTSRGARWLLRKCQPGSL